MDEYEEIRAIDSKFAKGSPERILSEHLDSEGFGYWVNTDEIVDEVKKLGWERK